MTKTFKSAAAFLFAFAIAISVTPVMAQRQPNLTLAHYWGKAENTVNFIKDNDAIVVDGNTSAGTYFLQWRIVNSGATANDTIAISDTVKIKTGWTTYKVVWGQGQFPNGMKQQDTVFITPATNPVTLPLPAGLTVSNDSVITQWCDSVYFIPGESTNPAVEADTSDNKICDTVFVTYWRTHVEEIIEGSRILLYPNPAAGELNVKFKAGAACSHARILNALGTAVISHPVNESESKMGLVKIDVNGLPPGLYLLQLLVKTSVICEKFHIR